jgi:hypothetical protein
MVKNIRTMKTILKNSILTPEVKGKISNIENHVINLTNIEDQGSDRSVDSSLSE